MQQQTKWQAARARRRVWVDRGLSLTFGILALAFFAYLFGLIRIVAPAFGA